MQWYSTTVDIPRLRSLVQGVLTGYAVHHKYSVYFDLKGLRLLFDVFRTSNGCATVAEVTAEEKNGSLE